MIAITEGYFFDESFKWWANYRYLVHSLVLGLIGMLINVGLIESDFNVNHC